MSDDEYHPCVARTLGKHHREYISEHNSPTWCGSTTAEKGWCFVSIDHAAENRNNRAYLLICPACREAIIETLKNED